MGAGRKEVALWVIRGGNEGELHEDRDFREGCAAVGWGDMGDLAGLNTKASLLHRMSQVWPEWTDPQVSNMCGQLWSFKTEIRRVDLVFRRLKKRPSLFAIAEVTGDYRYHPHFEEFPGYPHIREVRWISRDNQRNSLEPEMLKFLGQPRTVFQVKQEFVIVRIQSLASRG